MSSRDRIPHLDSPYPSPSDLFGQKRPRFDRSLERDERFYRMEREEREREDRIERERFDRLMDYRSRLDRLDRERDERFLRSSDREERSDRSPEWLDRFNRPIERERCNVEERFERYPDFDFERRNRAFPYKDRKFVNIPCPVSQLAKLKAEIQGKNNGNLPFISKEINGRVTLRGVGSGYEEEDTHAESTEPLHLVVETHTQADLINGSKFINNLLDTVFKNFNQYLDKIDPKSQKDKTIKPLMEEFFPMRSKPIQPLIPELTPPVKEKPAIKPLMEDLFTMEKPQSYAQNYRSTQPKPVDLFANYGNFEKPSLIPPNFTDKPFSSKDPYNSASRGDKNSYISANVSPQKLSSSGSQANKSQSFRKEKSPTIRKEQDAVSRDKSKERMKSDDREMKSDLVIKPPPPPIISNIEVEKPKQLSLRDMKYSPEEVDDDKSDIKDEEMIQNEMDDIYRSFFLSMKKTYDSKVSLSMIRDWNKLNEILKDKLRKTFCRSALGTTIISKLISLSSKNKLSESIIYKENKFGNSHYNVYFLYENKLETLKPGHRSNVEKLLTSRVYNHLKMRNEKEAPLQFHEIGLDDLDQFRVCCNNIETCNWVLQQTLPEMDGEKIVTIRDIHFFQKTTAITFSLEGHLSSIALNTVLASIKMGNELNTTGWKLLSNELTSVRCRKLKFLIDQISANSLKMRKWQLILNRELIEVKKEDPFEENFDWSFTDNNIFEPTTV